jgi:hypothetical protein
MNENIHVAFGVSTKQKERHGLMLEGDRQHLQKVLRKICKNRYE